MLRMQIGVATQNDIMRRCLNSAYCPTCSQLCQIENIINILLIIVMKARMLKDDSRYQLW